jgi:hypothetical protein
MLTYFSFIDNFWVIKVMLIEAEVVVTMKYSGTCCKLEMPTMIHEYHLMRQQQTQYECREI